MLRDTNIRVRTSKHHRNIYNDLKGVLVKDFHELFFLAACVGYRYQLHLPLGTEGEDRFWSRTITAHEWSVYYSMILAIDEMNLSSIQDDNKVIEKIEGFANGGLIFLLDDVLDGYVFKQGKEYSLDRTTAKDLPRRVLAFIHDQAEVTNA